jgi:hypothetical protein
LFFLCLVPLFIVKNFILIFLYRIGEGCLDKPLATLWKNYCQSSRPDVSMRLSVCSSGLQVSLFNLFTRVFLINAKRQQQQQQFFFFSSDFLSDGQTVIVKSPSENRERAAVRLNAALFMIGVIHNFGSVLLLVVFFNHFFNVNGICLFYFVFIGDNSRARSDRILGSSSDLVCCTGLLPANLCLGLPPRRSTPQGTLQFPYYYTL